MVVILTATGSTAEIKDPNTKLFNKVIDWPHTPATPNIDAPVNRIVNKKQPNPHNSSMQGTEEMCPSYGSLAFEQWICP